MNGFEHLFHSNIGKITFIICMPLIFAYFYQG